MHVSLEHFEFNFTSDLLNFLLTGRLRQVYFHLHKADLTSELEEIRINVVGDMTIHTSIFLHFKNLLCSEQLCHCPLQKLILRNNEA